VVRLVVVMPTGRIQIPVLFKKTLLLCLLTVATCVRWLGDGVSPAHVTVLPTQSVWLCWGMGKGSKDFLGRLPRSSSKYDSVGPVLPLPD
jgi:hypothetical protein